MNTEGQNVLLLDAGNTRLKWAMLVQDLVVEQGALDYTALEALGSALGRYKVARVLACNVAGPDVAGNLSRMLAPLSIDWLKSSAEMAGVRNAYRTPGQLGADRWAALIGARGLVQGDAIVVMAGTALTVDALDADGQFLGGVIAPGFRLMRESLAQGTADLGLPDGTAVIFPRSTGEAIVNGALVAMVGAIETMRQRLEMSTGRCAQVLLSGGDAALLAPLLRPGLAEHLITVDNLVLSGLQRLATLT